MARIALLCPDLLFGSKLIGALEAAGHEVERYDSEEGARAAAGASEVLIVDLTSSEPGGMDLVRALRGVRTLAFYSHIDQETRRRAEAAGFDRVVPRSRMAREAAGLVERLLHA